MVTNINFKLLFLIICICLLVSCGNNNNDINSIPTLQINTIQENIQISFSKESSFIFKVYTFNLETKQWETLLLTKENLKWDQNSYITLFYPNTNKNHLCLEMKYQSGNVEKYGYDNDYYEKVICNEENFTWIFNDSVILDEEKEIPIAFGVFSNDFQITSDFNSLLLDTSKIESNMIMFTIKKP